VVGLDITSGLPRVEELFEARPPKAQSVISEIDGVAEVAESEEGRRIKITTTDVFRDEYPLLPGWQVMVDSGQWVNIGTVLASPAPEKKRKKKKASSSSVALTESQPILARVAGEVTISDKQLSIKYEETEEREYAVPAATHIRVQEGDMVKAGQRLTDGSVNPRDILSILGKEAVQRYLVEEVQKVYCSQGVHINDKHIEVIVRQMLAKVRIDSSGDTDLVPGELVDKFGYEEINAKVLAEGGEPATAHTVLLGITRASLSTSSWLAAASFQETTRVLTDAAVYGKADRLTGLKENVIIGKLIPARCPACKEAPEEAEAELVSEEVPQLVSEETVEEKMPELVSEETVEEKVPELVSEETVEEKVPELVSEETSEEKVSELVSKETSEEKVSELVSKETSPTRKTKKSRKSKLS
jgi:DNA-directed RNA polymerase subunit beta'